MARKSILTPTERENLIPFPESVEICNQLYEFSREDRNLIFSKRTDPNRLGFAVHLCLLRYPGTDDSSSLSSNSAVVQWVARELDIAPRQWKEYVQKTETRWDHLKELRTYLNLKNFGKDEYDLLLTAVTERALQCDTSILLAEFSVEYLYRKQIVLPSVQTIEDICISARTAAERGLFKQLTKDLSDRQKELMDRLFQRALNLKQTGLTRIRRPITGTKVRDILKQIALLNEIRSFEISREIPRMIHRNRLRKLARTANKIEPGDLARLEPTRRYGLIVALMIDLEETVVDELISQHDKVMGRFFSTANNRVKNDLLENGKQILEAAKLTGKLLKLIWEAKKNNTNVIDQIPEIISWDQVEKRAADDSIDTITDNAVKHMKKKHSTLKRYAPKLLQTLSLSGASCSEHLLESFRQLDTLYRSGKRKLPDTISTKGIQDKWESYVIEEDGSINREYYELWIFSELRDAIRRGDIWVDGSRQFRSPESLQIPMPLFIEKRDSGTLQLAVSTNCREFLDSRITLLKSSLNELDELAGSDGLEDVHFTGNDVKISNLETVVPPEATDFVRSVYSRLRRIKITDLLQEVNEITDFTRLFTHQKTENLLEGRKELLTVILADGINLGLQKMAESCPGMNYDRLSRIQTWYVRDETYQAAIAEIVNHQLKSPIAQIWGDGTTSSSDGQQFRAGRAGVATGHVNLKYGTEPGRMVYTHVSDQYTPFYVKVINVGVRDSTYVLDGLLYHESDLEVTEHYTDTNGFTDHVFALMTLLGFRFSPRIRDFKESKIYVPEKGMALPNIATITGSEIDFKLIEENWNEILRLAASIREGTVTASLMMRKLASYPRQNTLAVSLRELGKLERSLFMCEWLKDPKLRRRTSAGLNKGEARHALGRAVHFNRLGEFRDRTVEQQMYRASGLTLVTDCMIHWTTCELERVVDEMKSEEIITGENEHLLQHVSPLGWDHINLTGDYIWR